jgi:catechol 2,3-dioxygenase-like lactoylglutathione lyase family enzyme
MVENMIDIFGLQPSQITGGKVRHHENTIYRGVKQENPPGVRMDFFDKFPLELEYLSPTDGDSAWMEFYKKNHKGLHHIRFNVSSHKKAIAYMEKKGIKVIHEADSPRGEGLKFAYFDSFDKLGFYIETINFAEMS